VTTTRRICGSNTGRPDDRALVINAGFNPEPIADSQIYILPVVAARNDRLPPGSGEEPREFGELSFLRSSRGILPRRRR
jgi:hypothetical protein